MSMVKATTATRHVALAAVLLMLNAACRPAIRPYDEEEQGLTCASVVLVGRILSGSNVGGPQRFESHGITWQAQLFEVTVAVENVLKGDVPAGNATIYYFLPAGPYDGPALMGMEGARGQWHVGDREMFFLNRDSGVLRTVCDYYRHCVIPVFCAHPGFKPAPFSTLPRKIIDFLLSRGPGCSDQQMIEAISRSHGDGFDRDYWLEKLQEIALSETPAVRQAACNELSNWNQSCPKR